MSEESQLGPNDQSLHQRLLNAAWTAYHEESTEPDTFYSMLYLEGRNKNPESRLDRLIIFLAVWNAWNWHVKGEGVVSALEFLPKFLRDNASTIQELRHQSLLTLDNGYFSAIRALASELDKGLEFIGTRYDGTEGPMKAQTAWGKTLHFLAPESILLWDAENVRNGPLQLGDGPDDFVVLQRWGQRLLRHLEDERKGSVARMLVDHRKQTRGEYSEPITKFLDETMYDHDTIRQAKRIVGRPYD